MKVLITGGAGFIGSHLVRGCLKEGWDVTVLDNLVAGNLNNLEDVKGKYKFVQDDILNLENLKKHFKGIDRVFHLAALVSVPNSIANPLEPNEVNITGTLNVLMAAKEAKVGRVMFACSSSVYGDAPIPKREDYKVSPLSPYGLHKITGEFYMKLFYDLYGLETISLRFFNIFGPRQNPLAGYAAVIPKFITTMLKDQQPVIFGDGTNSRDFTFVENVVHANILAAKAKKTMGDKVNVACGQRITILELVEQINKALGKNIKPILSPPRAGDIKHSLADLNHSKEIIGYTPQVQFADGLKKTVEWYREHYGKL